MNANRKPLSWKTVGIVVALALVSAYQMWQTSKQPVAETTRLAPATPIVNTAVHQETTATRPVAKPASKQPSASAEPFLKPGPRGIQRSPAGLIYTSSASGEHRTTHVLKHSRDIPDRAGSHGVFDAEGDEVFRLLDEAYKLIRSDSSRVKREPADADFKTAYVIQMQRRIGYRGGQSGARSGNPPLTRIKLVLAEDRVITAYPF